MAYRLAVRQAVRVFKLRGLDASRNYRVSIDGTEAGTLTGQDLRQAGLRVELDDAWRAAVVEVSSVR